MKKLTLTVSLLKGLAFAALLTACNNDQAVMPIETASASVNNQNAKISSLLRLIKEGDRTIQYVKSGKFFGRVSNIDEGSSTNYRLEYSYNDNNPAGDVWISKKRFSKSTNTFIQEWKYKVTNGLCVTSEDVAQGYSYEYKYNAQGLLDEIKMIVQGNTSANWKYTYTFNAATGAYRLSKIVNSSVQFGPNVESTFTYTAKPDIFPLNQVHGNIDKYLPIFGKFSDVLIEKVTEKSLQNPANPSENTKFTYITDVDGLVTSRTTEYTTGNSPSGVSYTALLKYSTTWQGI